MNEDGEILIPKEWVYVGQRVVDGKRVYAWKVLGENDSIGYYKKPLAAASVGGVYRFFESDDGKTIKVSGTYSPVYLRKHDNIEEVRIWAFKDEAAKQELSVKSMNTKASKVDPLEDLLSSLRRISKKLSSTERRALLSRIADEIFTEN
ncbi:hypothetical protein EHV15_34485 [Paenibacillus oralis]|uniref:Uncharacterized protein n=1 Tax=Paenibacillus oralis TaxID=2490856 RepID=A0A3P3T9K5_9BACL|nr:hypothetical protein [Paenibacillus oralis]RRJ54707.1 hypothetical protein EHV15_34485 [Paenibacillus oralis]